MNLGLLLPEMRIAFWIMLSIICFTSFILPLKFISFKGKEIVLAIGNIFMTVCYAIITSLFIIFYTSAGLLINYDFFASLCIVAGFLYLIFEYKKLLPKIVIYTLFLLPLVISFFIFFYLYNEDKIYKLSPHCQNTEDPKIKFCKYSNGTYTGEMKAFRRHGQGEYIWDSGKTYKGEWKNGKKLNQ